MSLADQIEARGLAQLHASDSIKWADPEQIGAFVAEMDFGVDPVISRALHQAVDSAAFGYSPPGIFGELREATATRLATRQHWQVHPEQVFPVADVLSGLEATITYLTTPGSKVIVPTPSYMPFLQVPLRQGREIIQVPMRQQDGRSVFDLDGIAAAFEAGGELLVLCNPFNPLGRVFDRDELITVSAVVDAHNGRVFSDEIWAPLIFDQRPMVSYATVNEVAAKHTVTAVAASKAWNLPGLKCAQLVVSNDADQAILERVRGWIGHRASNLGAVATIAAYRDGESWLAEVLQYLDGNRQELVARIAETLPGVGVFTPEGTYVAWLDFRGIDLADPAAFFREHAGVALTDGTACGEAGADHARLIFAMPRPVLTQTLTRMADAVRMRR